MPKRTELIARYPFSWLDELTEVILNPDQNRGSTPTPEDLQTIRERLPDEFSRIRTMLKTRHSSFIPTRKLK